MVYFVCFYINYIVDNYIVDNYDNYTVDNYTVDNYIGDTYLAYNYIADNCIVDNYIITEIKHIAFLLDEELYSFKTEIQGDPKKLVTKKPDFTLQK